MARPLKQGLSYFPLDVDIFEDQKLKDLNFSYGPLAEMVYIRILTMVYANGYYLEVDLDTLTKRLYRQLGPNWVKLTRVREFIDACVEFDLFDKVLSQQRIITSVSIQKQYILSTKRRQNVLIDKYWLLDRQSIDQDKVFLSIPENKGEVQKNGVIVDNNSINENKNTQSKSKSKREIDKIDKIDKSNFGHPKLHFITKVLIERKYIEESSLDLVKYNNLFLNLISTYGFDRTLSAVNYMIKYSKREKQPIVNKYAYMSEALKNNLEKFRRREERKISHETFESWMEQHLSSLD